MKGYSFSELVKLAEAALPATGTAVAAQKLANARTIGGVYFDGTANINLPGVNIAGNQNTSGNAASATKLQNVRTIAGQAFDGTQNVVITPATIGASSLGHTHTPAEVGLGNLSNNPVSVNADPASYALRDGNGDLVARAFHGIHIGDGANLNNLQWGKLTGIPATASRWPTAAEAGASPALPINADFGGDSITIDTAQFIEMLRLMGAFGRGYWCCRGSWSYATNRYVNTGIGVIHLAGAIVEVWGSGSGNCTIRVVSATTTGGNGASPNYEWMYVDNGPTYQPGWRLGFNTATGVPWAALRDVPATATRWPSTAEIGALPAAGGTVTGSLTVNGVIVGNDRLVGIGKDNLYTGAGLEARTAIGSTADPSVGFHAAGRYAGTLRMLGDESFGFLDAENTRYSNLRVRDLIAVGKVDTPTIATQNIATGNASNVGWYRSVGDVGWYNETYGGGVYMRDSTYVRVYGGKQLAVESTASDSINTVGGVLADRYQTAGGGTVYNQRGDTTWMTSNSISTTHAGIGVQLGVGPMYWDGAATKSIWHSGNAPATATRWPTAAEVGLGNVANKGWNYGVAADTYAVRDGNGDLVARWMHAAEFYGSGTNLTNLQWSRLTGVPQTAVRWPTWAEVSGKPAEASQWISLLKNTSTTCVKEYILPPQMLNHLAAGGMIHLRVFLNQSGTAAGVRHCKETYIDGSDEWQSGTINIDLEWPGFSYLNIRNNSTGFAANLRNRIISQYPNIQRVDMRLL
ncbi:tail fiber protein [Shewanella phage SppYZU05]|uniref:Chaperone of endosialidase n=1 Tax=Shewanella phage SppYZU05 TaxID=1970795 RepID=A0A1W6JTQ1_9CAUD|nr:tail fiber protein [Shewanella phage SppYZU05]ARM70595.1 chaperone of endosialidase [Shewanella phage SppYZU05]